MNTPRYTSDSYWKKSWQRLVKDVARKEINANKMSIDARYRTMLILWIAQMMSLVMFLFLTQFIAGSSEQPPAANNLLSFIFASVGSFSVIISFVVRSTLLQRSVEKQDPSLVQTALVAGCALCEVPGLLGVVERFVLPGRDYLLLLAVSFLGMALHFPRRANLLAASYKDPSYGATL